MPEMDICWPSIAGLDFQWTQIFTYMGWPQDHLERAARIARYFAEDLGRLETRRREEARIEQVIDQFGLDEVEAHQYRATAIEAHERFIEPCRYEYYDTFTNEFGGFSALFEGSAGTKPFPWAEVLTVGHMLLTIRSIEVHHPALRGSGIRRAAFLIGRADPAMKLVTNERYARAAWSKYKNVSHLSAAFLLLNAGGIDHLAIRGLITFFALANDYEDFGTSFHAHSREEFLLDRDKVWSIPERLAIFQLKNPVVPPLHEDDVAILREYRPWDTGKRRH